MIKNFLVKRGDQLAFTITFTSDTPVSAMEFGVKERYSATDYTIIKFLGNGITKLSDKKYQIVVPSEDMAKLEIKNYVYDLRTKVGSVVRTPLSGKLMIKETVFEV